VKLELITEDEIANQNPDTPLQVSMHGTAHHLGLDVHDVGLYSRSRKGMVLTCEPGIYIPEEGIGCRLKNDYLIRRWKYQSSEAMPIEIDDIEERIRK
jgi:Xaa-Pro aminopeptidase